MPVATTARHASTMRPARAVIVTCSRCSAKSAPHTVVVSAFRRTPRLLAGHEAIEALVRVHAVLGFPHEVPFEFERSREVHGVRRRQRVVEAAVIRVRDEAL